MRTVLIALLLSLGAYAQKIEIKQNTNPLAKHVKVIELKDSIYFSSDRKIQYIFVSNKKYKTESKEFFLPISKLKFGRNIIEIKERFNYIMLSIEKSHESRK